MTKSIGIGGSHKFWAKIFIGWHHWLKVTDKGQTVVRIIIERPKIKAPGPTVIFLKMTATTLLEEVQLAKIRAIKKGHYFIYCLRIFLILLTFGFSDLNIASTSRLLRSKSTVYTILFCTWTPIIIVFWQYITWLDMNGHTDVTKTANAIGGQTRTWSNINTN